VTEAVKLAIEREHGREEEKMAVTCVGAAIAFEERGVQSIKGKGEMRTFFVSAGKDILLSGLRGPRV
jgi:hypothetical protein